MTAAMEPENEPDEAKCLAVYESLQSLMDTSDAKTIDWMTGELGNHLIAAMLAAKTSVQMQLLRRGVPGPEAEKSANLQIPLIAFNLGMQIGSSMEAARQMREMFGFGED